jgi:hypothetical protein
MYAVAGRIALGFISIGFVKRVQKESHNREQLQSLSGTID